MHTKTKVPWNACIFYKAQLSQVDVLLETKCNRDSLFTFSQLQQVKNILKYFNLWIIQPISCLNSVKFTKNVCNLTSIISVLTQWPVCAPFVWNGLRHWCLYSTAWSWLNCWPYHPQRRRVTLVPFVQDVRRLSGK